MLVFWRKRPIELANPRWHRQRHQHHQHHQHHQYHQHLKCGQKPSFRPRLAGSVCGSAWRRIFFISCVAGNVRMSGARWAAQNGHTRSPGASDWWPVSCGQALNQSAFCFGPSLVLRGLCSPQNMLNLIETGDHPDDRAPYLLSTVSTSSHH